MKINQLTRGSKRRLMYVENKAGLVDGASARIGWVSFSKTGRSLYYRGLELSRIKGGGISGNYLHGESGDEYWVSGVKRRGSNIHRAGGRVKVVVDDDATQELDSLRSKARA